MKTLEFDLLIDTREGAITKLLTDSYLSEGNIKINIIIKQTGTGDYIVFYKDTAVICIERKTHKDLADTIKKPERHDNYLNLLELREKTNGVCKQFYLIESNKHPQQEKTTIIGGLEYKALEAHLHHLMIDHQIPVLYSRDAMGTIEVIRRLIRSYSTSASFKTLVDSAAVDQKQPESKDIDMVMKRHKTPDSQVVLNMYSAISGVGMKTAQLMYLAKINLFKLHQGSYSSDELKDMKKEVKTIEKIAANAQKTKLSSILEAIPGISKETAELIESSVPDLVSLSPEDIEKRVKSIKKENGRKIGNSIATKVGHFIRLISCDVASEQNPSSE